MDIATAREFYLYNIERSDLILWTLDGEQPICLLSVKTSGELSDWGGGCKKNGIWD